MGDKLVQVLEKCNPQDVVRYCPPANPVSMFCTSTDPFEIQKVLMSLKSNKSPGAHNISLRCGFTTRRSCLYARLSAMVSCFENS